MSYFSKHYEKFALAAFLLIFISALLYLIIVFNRPPPEFEIITRKPDYPSIFDEFGKEIGNKKRYWALENLDQAPKFINLVSSSFPDSLKRDLMSPISTSRCPNCTKLLPLRNIQIKRPCLFCNFIPTETPPPPPEIDSDGDGMPNLWEMRYGLNPNSPNDKMSDKDKDGFPNFIEYHEKIEIATNPADPESHPPLAWRLQFIGLKRTLIPLRLLGVKTHKNEKKEWLGHLEVKNHKDRWSTKFIKIGDDIRLGFNVFKVTDIIIKEKEKWDPALHRKIKVNIPKVIIKNTQIENDRPITVNLKKPVYENLVNILMIDSLSQKGYLVKVGTPFFVGDNFLGKEKYQIISFEDKSSATIRPIVDDKQDLEELKISKRSILEQKIEACGKMLDEK